MILAIESAVAGGSLSFLNDGEAIVRWYGNSDISRAEDLMPAIERSMDENNIARDDLSMIAVSAGPGSFTGIRIGMSTAMGLAAGLDLPVVSASVLKAMAATAKGDRILTGIPMGRGSICVQVFVGEDDAPTAVDEPATVRESEFTDLVQSSSGDIVVHGSLADLCAGRPVIDLGLDLATVLGKYCHQHSDERETPLFISKSF